MNVSSKARVSALLVAVLLASIGMVFIGQPHPAHAMSRHAGEVRLRPSGEGLPFDPARYRDFEDYIRQTREMLLRHKVYMDPGRTGTELTAAMPFESMPAEGCLPPESRRAERGILLLHGLSDMPLAMRDLADAFAARCFLVRAMLLPGHGTRAGDLLHVSRSDWQAAMRFGLGTVKEDADAVFTGGFSLGGLLSIYALLDDATVQGAFVFSPALALERQFLVGQAVWMRRTTMPAMRRCR